MKKFTFLLLLLPLIVIPGFAAAAPNAISSGQDMGQQFIDWIAYGTTSPTFGAKSLMSTASSVINVLALVVMAALAIVGGTTYVIQTANKGTPGGEVISSFWMPIRIVVATILLIPLASGFSTLQYGVIKIAEKGNSHANYLVEKAVDYLYTGGIYRAPSVIDGRSVVLNMLSNEVCAQYINSYTGQETIKVNKSSKVSNDLITTQYSYDYVETEGTAGQNNPRIGYCGGISYSLPISVASADDSSFLGKFLPELGVKTASGIHGDVSGKLNAVLIDTQSRVSAIASKLLEDETYLKQLQQSGASAQNSFERAAAQITGNLKTGGSDIESAIINYNAKTQEIVTSAVNSANGDTSENNWASEVKKSGWPAFGTIYWIVSKRQSEINKLAASIAINVSTPDIDNEWLKDPRFADVYARVGGATKAFYAANNGQLSATFDLGSIASAATSGDGGWANSIKKAVYDAFSGVFKTGLFRNGGDDLIVNIQYFGSAIGTFAEAMFWNKMIGVAVGKGAAQQVSDESNNVANAGVGLGNVLKPATAPAGLLGKTIANFMDQISPFIDYLLIAMIIVGFTLGIVLPSIPVVLWLMGVLSWLLFYIECLLVSPFWLSAHGTAEKEGWGSEHSRQGYMLMIGLYLNPILRVAGFCAIFMLMKPAGVLVTVLMDYISGVITSGFMFLFYNLGAMVLLSAFLYTALVRIFSLPSELFEKGLRWVNGGQEVTGDSHSEQQARTNIAVFGGEGKTAAGMAGRNQSRGIELANPGSGDPKK